jgi:hypothetical protein
MERRPKLIISKRLLPKLSICKYQYQYRRCHQHGDIPGAIYEPDERQINQDSFLHDSDPTNGIAVPCGIQHEHGNDDKTTTIYTDTVSTVSSEIVSEST